MLQTEQKKTSDTFCRLILGYPWPRASLKAFCHNYSQLLSAEGRTIDWCNYIESLGHKQNLQNHRSNRFESIKGNRQQVRCGHVPREIIPRNYTLALLLCLLTWTQEQNISQRLVKWQGKGNSSREEIESMVAIFKWPVCRTISTTFYMTPIVSWRSG